MDLKTMMAGRKAPAPLKKSAHTCRAHTVRGRDGEGDMGQTLLTSGPSSRGVEGESKRAFAYEVLLPGNADNTFVGAFRSDFHPGDRPLGTMTFQGQIWMCLASHRIVRVVEARCGHQALICEAARADRLDRRADRSPAPAAQTPAPVWAKAALLLPSWVQLRIR
jgi:hypothetical protein